MEATGSAPEDEIQMYYNFISLNWNTEILPYASNSLWGFLRSWSCHVCTNSKISLDFWGSLCFHTKSNLPHNWEAPHIWTPWFMLMYYTEWMTKDHKKRWKFKPTSQIGFIFKGSYMNYEDWFYPALVLGKIRALQSTFSNTDM